MTASAHLILTLDYEVFGNGSGNLECCVLQPADRIASIAERHGARLEVFVDALEFEAMERHALPGTREVREQLQSFLRRGHHLQLHLHPQWHPKAQLEEGGWTLDRQLWRIGSMSPDAANECIRRGQRWLGSLMQEVDAKALPRAFRAGGWAIQPADAVLPVLAELGISTESSVAPGIVNRQASDWYDFSVTPDLATWPIDRDVCVAAPGGPLHEVPIAVGRIGRMRHLKLLNWSRGRLAPGCRGTYDSGGTRWQKLCGRLSKLRRVGITMLDYSVLDAAALATVASAWRDRWAAETVVPLVAIGHTKNFSPDGDQALDQFLTWAKAQPSYRLSSYGQFLAAR